jgi:outer membrane protein
MQPLPKEHSMPVLRPCFVTARPAAGRAAHLLRLLTLRPLVLACAVVFGATTSAQAQSLRELYDAARAYDATYLASKALADSAQYKAAQADALGRPTVGLSAGATQSRTWPPGSDSRGLTNLQVGLSATQPLYNPGNSASIQQAKRAQEATRTDLESAEQDLIVRVAQAYFDVLAAQDSLATAKTSKKAISEQLASAKRNFEVGTATITDTREAQARFDLSTAQELAADNDLLTKRLALDALTGRGNVAPKALAVPVLLPAVAPPDVEAWVFDADTKHPLVRTPQLPVALTKLDTEKARANDGATVDLVGSAAESRNTGTAASPRGTVAQASVGVQLKLPLYSGGALQNRIKETLALEEKSRNALDAARRAVTQGTRASFFGVQSLLGQVKALEAAESSSQLALEATQLGYKVGVRVNLDVLNAQTQLFNARRDLAKARYDTLLTGLKLRQASGQLKADDVDVLNSLLAK